jgi:hypothetical protein
MPLGIATTVTASYDRRFVSLESSALLNVDAHDAFFASSGTRHSTSVILTGGVLLSHVVRSFHTTRLPFTGNGLVRTDSQLCPVLS